MNEDFGGAKKLQSPLQMSLSIIGRRRSASGVVMMVLMVQLLGLVLLIAVHSTNALFADEAGQADFLKQTAGHGGPFTFTAFVEDPKATQQTNSVVALVTSTATSSSIFEALVHDEKGESSSAQPRKKNNPCYVTSRHLQTGENLWRRNVCTKTTVDGAAVGIAMTNDNKHVLTLDGTSGIVQKWTSQEGTLLWNTKVPLPVEDANYYNGAAARILSFDDDKQSSYVVTVTSYDASPPTIDDNNRRHYRNAPPHTEVLSVLSSDTGDVIPLMYASPESGRHRGGNTPANAVTGITAGQLLDDHEMKVSSVSHEQQSSPRFVHMVQHVVNDKPYLFVIVAHVPAQSTIISLSQIGIFQIELETVDNDNYKIDDVPAVTKRFNVVETWCMKDVLGRQGAALLDVSTFHIVKTGAQQLVGVVVKKQPPPSPGVQYAPGKQPKSDDLLLFDLLGGSGNSAPSKLEWTSSQTESPDQIDSIQVDEKGESSTSKIMIHVTGSQSSAIVQYDNSQGGTSGGTFEMVAGRSAVGGRTGFPSSITLSPSTCVSDVTGSTNASGLLSKNSIVHVRATSDGSSLEFIHPSSDTVDVSREEIVRRKVSATTDDSSSTHTVITHVYGAKCSSSLSDDGTVATYYLVLGMNGGVQTTVVGVSLDSSWTVRHMFDAHEELANIQSTIVMDLSMHISVPTTASTSGEDDDEEDLIPSFTDRLLMQASSIPVLGNLMLGGVARMVDDEDHTKNRRDINFGFQKLMVALTKNGELYGLDMSPQQKGTVMWSLPVHDNEAVENYVSSIVYNGKDHGQHHAHSNELLVVSTTKNSQMVHWKCVDGIHGKLLKEGTFETPGNMIQLGALRLDHGGTGTAAAAHHHYRTEMGCHQQAIALWEDGTATVIPPTPTNTATFVNEIMNEDCTSTAGTPSMFMHSINQTSGVIQSVKLMSDNNNQGERTASSTCSSSSNEGECRGEANRISSLMVGEMMFDTTKEQIIKFGYPNQEEVVQSPVTILGDDSLLIKYLNPHLAVVVTEATSHTMQTLVDTLSHDDTSGVEDSGDGNSQEQQLVKHLAEGSDSSTSSVVGRPNRSSSSQTKKPMGVTAPATKNGASSSPMGPSSSSIPMPKEAPSLFVNLVDTVSGKLLFRVAHKTKATSSAAAATNSTAVDGHHHDVSVAISENWITYTFWNDKSKRTEVGVMTLFEGMIDKHGLTAFHHTLPQDEHNERFTSLESSKPLVLHRTFSLGKHIKAISFTQTARGISSKQLVLALDNGQIASIDRRLLDPRRPSSEPKPEEKLEGLFQYSPILPLISQKVVSYHNIVEGVTHVTCVAAHIESQTFVIAYGGPDLFVARIAPSKGFDLLPENFSKGLLSMVVLGLVGVTIIIHGMSQKKVTSVIWS